MKTQYLKHNGKFLKDATGSKIPFAAFENEPSDLHNRLANKIESLMTPEQIEKNHSLAKEWILKHKK